MRLSILVLLTLGFGVSLWGEERRFELTDDACIEIAPYILEIGNHYRRGEITAKMAENAVVNEALRRLKLANPDQYRDDELAKAHVQIENFRAFWWLKERLPAILDYLDRNRTTQNAVYTVAMQTVRDCRRTGSFVPQPLYEETR